MRALCLEIRGILNMADRAYVLETGLCTVEGEAKDILLNEHVKKAYLGIT